MAIAHVHLELFANPGDKVALVNNHIPFLLEVLDDSHVSGGFLILIYDNVDRSGEAHVGRGLLRLLVAAVLFSFLLPTAAGASVVEARVSLVVEAKHGNRNKKPTVSNALDKQSSMTHGDHWQWLELSPSESGSWLPALEDP